MPNYYDLLGIPPNAPLSDVQAAYEMQRRHAEWRSPGDPALLAQYDAAWRVLSDPASRHAYDQEIRLRSAAPSSPADQWSAGQQWAGYQQQYAEQQQYPTTGQYPTGQYQTEQYPTEQHPQQGVWETAGAGGRPPGRSECRLCGSAPAAPGRFRAHQGIILMMRFRHLDGPFCRDCGLAVFRDMTAKTLLQGWWGLLSFFITIGTVAKNAFLRGRFASLGAPRRDPTVQAPYERPLDSGKPLLRRPAAFGLLIPLVLLGIVAFAIRADQPAAQVGKCVQISGKNAKLVSCSERHNGKVVAVADNLEQCPEEATGAVKREEDNGKVLCVVTSRQQR
jgi:hypothetical protein